MGGKEVTNLPQLVWWNVLIAAPPFQKQATHLQGADGAQNTLPV